jgi:hypothetical protein
VRVTRIKSLTTIACLAAALLAAPAGAALPERGVLEPGASLGGIRIGMTKSSVREAWGKGFGRCRSCPDETWYFTYRRFEPQGAGIAFARGRVMRVYTLWQPSGWRTSSGLVLGSSEAEVTSRLGGLPREECSGYAALIDRGDDADSIYYLDEGTLWGFGLIRAGLSPCL